MQYTVYNVYTISSYQIRLLHRKSFSLEMCYGEKMRDREYRIIKAATQVILGVISTVFPVASAAGPIADLAFDAIQEKDNARISVSDSEIRKKCELQLKENTGRYSDNELEMLTATVSICLDNIKTLSQVYDDNLAETLSAAFLDKRKTYFGEREYAFLRNNLSGILRKVIHELERDAEKNPEFQVAWKHYIASYCRTVNLLSEQVADQDKRLANHDRRIIELEKRPHILLRPIVDLSETYQSRWNDTMFLDRDKDITLSSVYQLPHYEDEEEPLFEILQSTLDLCNSINNRALLVLGHPGSGKSTLISFLLNKCQIQRDRTVRVFRFSGFEGIDWNGNAENLPQQMLNCMGLEKTELSNSVLILDGLDEVDMRLDQEELIEELFKQWIRSKKIMRFSLFITCRTNRVEEPERLPVRYVVLSPLQEDQITEFVVAYLSQKDNNTERIKDWLDLVQNEESISEVIGIPLFLYLALALDVQIEKNSSLENIYSQIFTLDGNNSIYYRSAYDKKHPITSVEANAIHSFSKRFAEKIWDVCPNEATAAKELYLPIVSQIIGDDQSEFRKILVGQYFIEGSDGSELLFAHRSMYEYFVAVSIYDDFLKAFETNIDPYQMLKELNVVLVDLSCILGLQNLSSYPEIQSYLKSMLERSPIGDIDWWHSFFAGFIKYGLSELAVGRRKGGQKGLKEELNRFYNLIWITREQLIIFGESVPVEIDNTFSEITLLYIPYEEIVDLHGLNLNQIRLFGRDLHEAVFYESDLTRANFANAELQYADFRKAQLNEAILTGTILLESNCDEADFTNADLRDADLSESSFQYAVFRNADLSGANLNNADLSFADFTGANLQGATLLGASIEETLFEQADFSRAILSDLDFSGLNCKNACFVEAKMSNVIAKKTNFTGANLTKANLSNAELSGSNLTNARMNEADLNEAYFKACRFVNSHLRDAELMSVQFEGSIFRGADLVDSEADNASFRSVTMEKTNLCGASLTYADFSGALLDNVKVTSETLSSIICNASDRAGWTLVEEENEDYSFEHGHFSDYISLLPEYEDSNDWNPRRILEEYYDYLEEETFY